MKVQKKELLQQILSIKDEDTLNKFMNGILTKAEYDDLVTRLQIVKNIKSGMPHREIAEKLGVGVATVSRGSKEVQSGNFDMV